MRISRLALAATTSATAILIAIGPLALDVAGAGADTTLVGYNASALAVGAQFAFNVPNVVPLPNENLIEEDVPFSRTNVGSGPVVDALGAPYYPGDIAADLGSLLITFGAPALPLNDPLLAEAKYPTSPGYKTQATFAVPNVTGSTANASTTGGSANASLSSLNLDTLGVTKILSLLSPKNTASILDIGNISTSNAVTLGTNTVTSTATSQVNAIDIAGLVDIAGLTSTATAASDGTTGTPTASLHLGQVTVDGVSAYIDGTGVHITTAKTPNAPITPAQLQQTVNATLAQDGISIRLLDPQLTTNGAQASADAGGLVIALSHQFDVPFIPGEPTIPVPALGNVGLPAGLYTATTSLTFGLAQASVSASGGAGVAVPPDTTSTSSGVDTGADATGTDTSGFGSGFGAATGGVVQSLTPTGPGVAPQSAAPSAAAPTTATDFPIHGVPPPLGWSITALLACVILAYPLLLLARWQFVAGRRSQ